MLIVVEMLECPSCSCAILTVLVHPGHRDIQQARGGVDREESITEGDCCIRVRVLATRPSESLVLICPSPRSGSMLSTCCSGPVATRSRPAECMCPCGRPDKPVAALRRSPLADPAVAPPDHTHAERRALTERVRRCLGRGPSALSPIWKPLTCRRDRTCQRSRTGP